MGKTRGIVVLPNGSRDELYVFEPAKPVGVGPENIKMFSEARNNVIPKNSCATTNGISLNVFDVTIQSVTGCVFSVAEFTPPSAKTRLRENEMIEEEEFRFLLSSAGDIELGGKVAKVSSSRCSYMCGYSCFDLSLRF